MKNRCSICNHEKRSDIEQALASSKSLRGIAGDFGVTKDAVGRHRAHIEPRADPLQADLSPCPTCHGRMFRWDGTHWLCGNCSPWDGTLAYWKRAPAPHVRNVTATGNATPFHRY